jgi:hypothetical protein
MRSSYLRNSPQKSLLSGFACRLYTVPVNYPAGNFWPKWTPTFTDELCPGAGTKPEHFDPWILKTIVILIRIVLIIIITAVPSCPANGAVSEHCRSCATESEPSVYLCLLPCRRRLCLTQFTEHTQEHTPAQSRLTPQSPQRAQLCFRLMMPMVVPSLQVLSGCARASLFIDQSEHSEVLSSLSSRHWRRHVRLAVPRAMGPMPALPGFALALFMFIAIIASRAHVVLSATSVPLSDCAAGYHKSHRRFCFSAPLYSSAIKAIQFISQ